MFIDFSFFNNLGEANEEYDILDIQYVFYLWSKGLWKGV